MLSYFLVIYLQLIPLTEMRKIKQFRIFNNTISLSKIPNPIRQLMGTFRKMDYLFMILGNITSLSMLCNVIYKGKSFLLWSVGMETWS